MNLEKFSSAPENKTEISVPKNELEGPYAVGKYNHDQGKYHKKDNPTERYHRIMGNLPLQIMATRLLKGILPVADIVNIEGEKRNGLFVYASKENDVEDYEDREIEGAAKADMFIITGVFGDTDHYTNNLKTSEQSKKYYHYDFGQVSAFDKLRTDQESFRKDVLERWANNYDKECDLDKPEFRQYLLRVLDQIEDRLTPTEKGDSVFDAICDRIIQDGEDMYRKSDPEKMEVQTNDPMMREMLDANPIYTAGEDLIAELWHPDLRSQYRESYLFRIEEMRKYVQSRGARQVV